MRFSSVFVVLILVVPSSLLGGTNGIIEGEVRDKKSGEAVPGTSVLILELQTGAATDTSGRYQLRNIPSGRYTLRFTHVGYATALVRQVSVHPDLRTVLDARLEPSDVRLGEVVIVHEEPLVHRDVTGTAYFLSGDEIELLPVQEVTDVLGLKAGVTSEGNVRGGKATEVSYLVDGIPIQDLMSGGEASALPASSVFGVSLYTGGFEPEYGNALSGVVNIVTRTGGDEHRLIARADKDNLFGVPQSNRASGFELSASGPLIGGKLFYTGAARGLLSDTRWWQDFQYFFSGPIDRTWNGFAKLDYLAAPTLRLSGQALLSRHDWRDYEFPWRFNLGGLPPERKTSSRFAAIVSHTPSQIFSYTASLSRYLVTSSIGDGSAADVPRTNLWQYDFYLRFVVAGQRAWWVRTSQESTTGKFDGTLAIGETHLVKFGVEGTLFSLQSDVIRFEPRTTYFGKPLLSEPPLDFSSAYRYFPRSGSVYVQDKIDVLDRGGLVNVGCRYDILDTRSTRPAIGSAPADSAAGVASAPVAGGVKSGICPRLGIAMKLDELSTLFLNLGWYIQFPLFDYLYTGLDRVALARGVSAVSGNPGLEPERSRMVEISYKHVLPRQLVIGAAYFRKTTTNLVDTKTFVSGDSKQTGSFGFAEYVNNPYTTASGVEITLSRDRGEWVTGEVSYTLMWAEGVSGSATDAFYRAQFGLPPGVRIHPLSWDQRHAVTAVVHASTPWNIDAHAVIRLHTGRPYTYYPTSTGFAPIQTGTFSENNARMPGCSSVDLRLEYHVSLPWGRSTTATAYCDVRNLLNQRNVLWMDSNGRIGGELDDPSGYDIGRRTRLGIRLEL